MAPSRIASAPPRIATAVATSAPPVQAAPTEAADPLSGALANIAGRSTFEGGGSEGNESSSMVHGMVLSMVAEAADKARKETEHIKPLG